MDCNAAWALHVARHAGTPYHEKLTPTAAAEFRAGWEAKEASVREAVERYLKAGDVWGETHICKTPLFSHESDASAAADLELMDARDALRDAMRSD